MIKSILYNNPLFAQFLRYLFTGGLAFVVDFCLFALCLRVLGLHYLWANFIGLIAGLAINYVISILWVFKGCNRIYKKSKKAEFTIFSIIGFIGVGLNQLLMLLMVGCMSLDEFVSKIISAAIVLAWNFLARKFILFKGNVEQAG